MPAAIREAAATYAPRRRVRQPRRGGRERHGGHGGRVHPGVPGQVVEVDAVVGVVRGVLAGIILTRLRKTHPRKSQTVEGRVIPTPTEAVLAGVTGVA